ncbi:MAG: Cell division protein ftsA [Parcubacteria group bacterium GW2011_GWA2_42_11]|nr:MAG: Cell division protein ftsA [Parcubacteria group bacterium GW2011_GWA2_42_11]KKT76479.1 MAG: Cell division protein ftsA [Parcubacteria group bacterium GW2011_GWF2_44_7]
MPREKTIIALDIGTSNIRLVVAKLREGLAKPQVIGLATVPSQGMRKGVVVDVVEVIKGIKQARDIVSKTTGLPIDHAFISIGGSCVTCRPSRGVIAVSRADGEISEEDRARSIAAASAISIPSNREVLHVLPRRFTVDSADSIKDPVGMHGVRLEVDALIVEDSTPFIKNLIKCVREAGLEEDGLLLTPLAAARSILTKRQKELGVLSLDLGGGTTGLTVYEEGDILHCAILPVGQMHVTNDIAIGLRVSIDVAEKIKLAYGTARVAEVKKSEIIDLAKMGEAGGNVSRQEVAEIMEARLAEIFDLVNKELKKIDRVGFLPAGIVLTGGGAKIKGIVEFAKQRLKLPAQLGFPQELEGLADQVDDPSFATVIGLIVSALNDEQKVSGRGLRLGLSQVDESFGKLKKWVKGFMP